MSENQGETEEFEQMTIPGISAIAAMNTGRNYICFEKDKDIFEIGSKRVTEYSK